MRINQIQQNKNYTNNNFKGTVSPCVKEFMDKCAKNEAYHYSLTLDGGVVKKSRLLKIKRAWNNVIKDFTQKVKQMHPDINMYVRMRKDEKDPIWGSYYTLGLENKKINSDIFLESIDALKVSSPYFAITSEKMSEKLKTLEQKNIYDDLLRVAISRFAHDARMGNMDNYQTKVKNILDFQSEAEGISKKQITKNIKRLNETVELGLRSLDSIPKNKELIDEIFGSDK